MTCCFYIVVNVRKIYHKLHQLHAFVLPAKMEKDAQNFDAGMTLFEAAIATLKSEKATILDTNERRVALFCFCFFIIKF